MLNISKCIYVLFLLAIFTFEYGGYKITILIIPLSLFLLYRRGAFKLKDLCFSIALLCYLLFILLQAPDLNAEILSLTSLVVTSGIVILSRVEVAKCNNFALNFVLAAIITDYLLISASVDMTQLFLGVESRYFTGAKPYFRATGIWAEPGTAAIALIIGALTCQRNFISCIKVTVCAILLLSPYAFLAFGVVIIRYLYKLVSPAVIVLVMCLISGPVMFVLNYLVNGRLFDILNDSSFQMRLNAFNENVIKFNDPLWYTEDILLADVGLWFDLLINQGPTMLFLLFIMSIFYGSPLILLVKAKSFSAYLIYATISKKIVLQQTGRPEQKALKRGEI